MTQPLRIAGIGAGIQGLAAAHSLRDAAAITHLRSKQLLRSRAREGGKGFFVKYRGTGSAGPQVLPPAMG